jgi:hypothetical protein
VESIRIERYVGWKQKKVVTSLNPLLSAQVAKSQLLGPILRIIEQKLVDGVQ